jgi:hypothetical protein
VAEAGGRIVNFGHGYSGRTKYGAKKATVGDEEFDSRREARRYQELLLLQRAGMISGLRRQERYEIIPEHREPDTVGPRGGRKKGKVIEKARYYVADFVYYDARTRELVVEDCKGYKTDVYRLKKALMFDRYGIRVKET